MLFSFYEMKGQKNGNKLQNRINYKGTRKNLDKKKTNKASLY